MFKRFQAPLTFEITCTAGFRTLIDNVVNVLLDDAMAIPV